MHIPLRAGAVAVSSLLVTAALIVSPSASAATTSTLRPTDDAYVHADNPSTNYGSATRIAVDNSPVKRTFLKFNVNLGGAQLQSAKLRLYNIDASSKGGQVYSVSDTSWTEGSVTWNTAPAFGQLIGQFAAVAPGTAYEVDVTSAVTGGLVTFGMNSPSTDGADYGSDEGPAGQGPTLIVTTSSPSPTPTPTPTATPTPTPTPSPSPTPTPTSTPPRDISPVYPNGVKDFVYGSEVLAAGGPGTTAKPESKLFYTPDGRWWGAFGSSGSGVQLFELVSGVWRARIRLPGSDAWDKADTLFDKPSATLYVSLRDQFSSSTNPRASKLYKVPYTGGGVWGTPQGPSQITTSSVEALTIARDSNGRIWTTWEASGAITAKVTAPGETSFSTTPLPTNTVDGDDLSAVVAFGTAATGYKIGVAWSDQLSKRFYFAWRNDSDPIAVGSWHLETAYGGGVGGCPTAASTLCSDDHVNIKTVGDEVYIAVKTSLNDEAQRSPSDPLIVVLRRKASGSWSSHPVSPVSQDASRPILLLSPALNRIYVFAQKAFNDVYWWQGSFTNPGFNSAAAMPWTVATSTVLNNPTSTKQVVDASTGVVVETSLESNNEYWHNELR